MRRVMLAMSVVVLGAVSSACATKGFVRTRVGEVNDKVGTLSKTVEESQERIRQNEARIGEVDQKAQAAAQSAQAANEAAAKVNARAEEIERQNRRLVYEVVLSEDQGNFKFDGAELPEEARARLDQLIAQLAADPKGVWIEIEGHTDSRGPERYNEELGLERAESVKRYLYEQHQVPLHKINVISYGETKPVAPNNTREGRAQNRRVVVRVLS